MMLTDEELLADWQIGAGEGDGVRSLLAFYPPEASNSNGISWTLVMDRFI